MKFLDLKMLLPALLAGSMCIGMASSMAAQGELALVSSGTGDPENMTLRAHRIISSADIVFTMGGRKDYFGDLIKDKPVYDAGHGLFGLTTDKKTGENLSEEKQTENALIPFLHQS